MGTLVNGASSTLSIVAKVNTTAPTTNTATKTAEDQTDPNSGNNSASATVTPVASDIAITKSVDNTRPNEGTNVTFTITATNNGPSGATGVVVNDLLPAGLSFVSANPSGPYNAGTGDWTIGALATGAPQTLTIVATATVTTPVTNTAFVKAADQPDPVSGNNTASVTVTGQAADIAITKTVDNATPALNSNVTFTITATNNGPNNATGVQVTDTLPAGLTFVSAAPLGVYNSGTGVWNVGSMANGANATLSIVAKVTTTAPVSNTATKTAEDQTDPVGTNNSASVTVTPVSADIAITKSVNNSTPTLNTNVIFTVTAHNNGPSTASGVRVTDLLPAGLVYVSSTVSGVTSYDSVTGFWTVGTLTNGSTATLTITATVTSLTNVTNTATKSAEDQVDPVTSNDSASSTVSCCTADIAVTKAVDNPTPDFGSNVTYTITATNNGPASATGLAITDQLPSGLIYLSSTVSAGTSYNSVSGVWSIGALPNTSTVTLTITAKVNTTAPVTNTATKTAENEADPTTGDDTASVPITPVAADIAITKTVSNTTPNLGSNATFTITATNNGPSTATGVLVSDPLPSGLTFVSANPGGLTTYDPSTGTWTIGTLTNGGSQTLSLVATVTTTGAVVNTATKTAEDQQDPVPGNNAASATVTGQAADIAVTKTVDNAAPNLNSPVTFTITAHNNGPSDATGVEVTDTLPAGLTYVSSATAAGTYVPATGIWHIGGLTNTSSATLTIVANVTTTATVTNTATRTAGNQPDPNSTNDSSSVMVTGQQADIAITKTVDNPVPDFGTNVTFNLTATNNGPSTATGVQVTDVLPAGLTFVSATPSVAYTSGTGVWNIGALLNGGKATLSIVATVNTTSPVTNTATKSHEDQPDPVTSNDSASATITPTALADIAITKTVDNATPNWGTNVTFTVTAHNNGPNSATGVVVTDGLPAGLTPFSATPSAGTTYSAGVWTIGPLANGGTATLSIVATVNTTAPVVNTATKTAETEVDPNTGNDSASVTVTPVAADIAIAKSVDNATPNLNSKVTFTVTATNNGPSNATNVVVTDPMPSGLTYFSYLASVGTYDSTTGIWSVPALANGAKGTLSVVATVTGTTLVTNTATKTTADQPDPVPGNNSASVSVTGQAADIGLTKSVSNTTPYLGANVTFTVTAHNFGPSNATGVVVSDPIPAGLALVSATPSVGTSYIAGVWTIGPLGNGASATLAIVATVNSTSAIINTATKTAEDQTDPVSVNNSASATVTGQAADIAITKTVDNATPNQNSNVTFTVTATNNGPSNATGVVVTDVLPSGLTLVSVAPSAGTSYSAGVWTIGPLNNLASATLTIVATVTGTTPVTNTATKTAEDQPDPVPGNDVASATVTGQAADIAITKTVDNPTPKLNSNVTFTVTATNNGPSAATGVVVTDLLPSGLTYVSDLEAVGTYDPITGAWSIGGLANGTSTTLTLVATATSTTTVTNTATKTGEVQPDPVSTNNSASAAVTGVSADISVVKTVNQTTPTVGQNVTYTLVAHNLGPSTATSVQLHDMLPAQVTFVSDTATQGIYDPATGIWNVGTMVNGATVTLSVVVTVKASGLIVNTVTVLPGNYFDPNLSNNISSVTIDPPALPGLPNTSAPDNAADITAIGVAPAPAHSVKGLLLAVLTVVAGLGVLSLVGVGRRRSRARFGRRRSRKQLDRSPGRVTIGLVAGLLCMAIISVSAGDLATAAPPTVTLGPVPGTQLIGSAAVVVNPPPAPPAQTFRTVTGSIVPSRLRIPAIGVDSWVGAVALRKDGSMNVPDNLWTSSWLSSGPRPGQPGNAVIAGHRGVGTPALFSHLESVKAGDRIYVSDAAGNQLIYEVTRVASMDLSTSTQVAVFGPTSGQNLVLITCFGRYIPSARTYDHRLVVFSQPVSN